VKVLALSVEEWQTAEPQAISSAVVLIMLAMVESKKLSTILKKSIDKSRSGCYNKDTKKQKGSN
jgi:hypothetical protein